MLDTTLDVMDLPSPLGAVRAVLDDGRLVQLSLEGGPSPRRAARPREPGEAAVATAVAAYFSGDFEAFDEIPLDLRGTPFQRRVWEALREIPPGETASYGDVAADLGVPTGARAVGGAVGSNPVWIVVPCHRVIRGDGTIGGYGGGIERKRWLLDHEGITL